MFGQMTAGSWIYIGTQGILQGTYPDVCRRGEKHFGQADLRGRTVLTAGLGGMGGAQPLAAALLEGAILCVEVDPSRIERRLATRTWTRRRTRSTRRSRAFGGRRRRARPVGRAARECCRRRTRARSARRALRPRHGPDGGARPAHGLRAAGAHVDEAAALRAEDPEEYLERARESIAAHVEALLEYVRQVATFSIMATTFEERRVMPV